VQAEEKKYTKISLARSSVVCSSVERKAGFIGCVSADEVFDICAVGVYAERKSLRPYFHPQKFKSNLFT
jgi:hypothetical protein